MSFPTSISGAIQRSHTLAAPSSVSRDTGITTAFQVFGYIVFTILITLVMGRAGAMASCVLLTLSVIYCAAMKSNSTIPFFLCYLALEGLYKYTSSFSSAVYAIKPTLEFVLLAALVQSNRQTNTSMKMPPLAVLIGMFGGWAAVEVFHPLGCGITGGVAQLIVWYAAPISLLWTGYNSVRSVKQVETICYTILTISVVVSVFAAVQFQMGQAWTEAHLPGYATINQGEWWVTNNLGGILATSWRPASTTVAGGGGGIWAIWGGAIGIAFLMSRRINLLWKCLIVASIAINAYGVIVSGCRLFLFAGMFEVMVLFVVLARTPREFARSLIMLGVASIMVWVGFSSAQSFSGGLIGNRYDKTLANPLAKYNQDRGGLERAEWLLMMLEQYPFGVGYERGTGGGSDRDDTGVAIARDDAFNSVSGDMGWPGLLFGIAIFLSIIARSWGSFRALKSERVRLVGAVFLAIMMGYIVNFFGGPTLNGGDTLWLLFAFMLAMPLVQQYERNRQTVQ